MNVLLYYPRLIAALLFGRPPRCHATLQHWVNAQIFWLWNQPWDNPLDTIGTGAVRLYAVSRKAPFTPWHWKARVASSIFRGIFLFLLFAWPVLSALIAFRAGNRRLARWNYLVDNFKLVLSEPWAQTMEVANPLDCAAFCTVLVYILGRTGRRIPDGKDETSDFCRRFGIPTPRVLTAVDSPAPGKKYIVKPIDGCRAMGIHITNEPQAYLSDAGVIVQEVVRNAPSLRRLWGTDTLGALRFITAMKPDGDYDVVGCVLRVPLGDSPFDNTCHGNAFAGVDPRGVLQRLNTEDGPKAGFSHHPTSGQKAEGMVIDGYADCARLALNVHRYLAPGMPVLNSDVAWTEQGPMLIELNRAPGQYQEFYRDGYSEKCVQAICRIIALVHRDPAAWLRLAASSVAHESSHASVCDRDTTPVRATMQRDELIPAAAGSRTAVTAGALD